MESLQGVPTQHFQIRSDPMIFIKNSDMLEQKMYKCTTPLKDNTFHRASSAPESLFSFHYYNHKWFGQFPWTSFHF